MRVPLGVDLDLDRDRGRDVARCDAMVGYLGREVDRDRRRLPSPATDVGPGCEIDLVRRWPGRQSGGGGGGSTGRCGKLKATECFPLTISG